MKYYIIAGEASGDLHGSNLMKGLIAEDPQADIRFWGGDLMASVGGTLVKHYKEGAVMGFWEVLKKSSRLLKNVKMCEGDILEWKPDVVILIDYPGFNFKIAEFAHNAGFKVFYYIAPKVWASREGRNKKLKAFVDKLFIIFPFEIPYFEQKGIPFIYKGNPLIDAVDSHSYEKLSQEPYVAVLAGSRKNEISRMMPVCMEAADKLGMKVIVAGAPARSREDYEQYIQGRENVELIFGRTYDVLKYAQAAVINSGTASLEAALIGTPQVVGYSSSKLTMFIALKILKVQSRIRFISLGNLIIDRPAFRELIQDDFNASTVVAEMQKLVLDNEYRARMLADYAEIREKLGGSGASSAIAKEMIASL